MTEPPKFTGKKRQLDTIQGYYLPLAGGQPVQVEIPGLPDPVIAIFSSQETLDRARADTEAFAYDQAMCISDQRGFLQSIPRSVEVIIDPVVVDGNTRYQRLLRD